MRVETERLFQLELKKMEEGRHNAAVRIQALFRARRSRMNNDLFSRRKLLLRSRAAIILQRHARGYAGRAKAERLRRGQNGWTDTLDGSLLARLGTHGRRVGRMLLNPHGCSVRQFCDQVKYVNLS